MKVGTRIKEHERVVLSLTGALVDALVRVAPQASEALELGREFSDSDSEQYSGHKLFVNSDLWATCYEDPRTGNRRWEIAEKIREVVE